MLQQIAEDVITPPQPANFRTEIPPIRGNIAAAYGLAHFGLNYEVRNVDAWPLSVEELGHQQLRDMGSLSVTDSGTVPSAALDVDVNWVHEAAYPALDLPPIIDPPADSSEESESEPPLQNAFAAVPRPEPVGAWLERAIAPFRITALIGTAPCDMPIAALQSRLAICRWAAGAYAEPVAARIQSAAALEPAISLAHTDLSGVLGAPPIDTTPDLAGWVAVPAPEHACAAVLASAAPSTLLDLTRGLSVPPLDLTPEAGGFAAIAGPEPVAAWIRSAVALEPVACLSRPDLTRGLVLPPLEITPDIAEWVALPALEAPAPGNSYAAALSRLASVTQPDLTQGLAQPALDTTPDPAGLVAVPAPEAVAAWVDNAAVLAPAAFLTRPALISGLLLPALDTTPDMAGWIASAGELAPEAALPSRDDAPVALQPSIEAISVPAWCERPMASLQPEPVWSFVRPSSASQLVPVLSQARPVLCDVILHTHMPLATSPRAGLKAEPVMSGAWPQTANTRVENVDPEPAFQIPVASPAPAYPGFAVAASAAGAAPEPVEIFVMTAQAAGPVAGTVPLQMPSIAAVSAGNDVPLALPAAGPQAEAAETLIGAATALPVTPARPAALQQFSIEGSTSASIALTELPPHAAKAAEPAPGIAAAARLMPLSVVRLALPEQRHQRATPAIPQPGITAIEYHTQRTRGVAYSRPEWKGVNYQPIPPAFTLGAALDKPEDLIRPKTPLTGIFPINQGKPLVSRSALMEHILRVAAAVLVITSIWTGATALKNARRVTVRSEDTAFATPNRVLTPESQKAAAKKAAESKGPFNWVRQGVANRASVQVADDFQHGMQKWGAEPGAMAPNWRRHPDGYAFTGALALLAPTTKFTDYKLEFFGQIDSKAVGWVVRAKDEKNYHAMKLTTVEKGLRPFIAVIHYDVVNGQAGRKFQVPLNVMVHNNRPFQVAVTVKGKHFTTEIDGEQVDNFREDALPTGGVGFFSEAGEQAHLYWARVTKNDDWLGHVCAFLSGGEVETSAELRGPDFPGGTPAPWMPAHDTLLSAAWIGLPSIRRNQSPRRHKRCNR